MKRQLTGSSIPQLEVVQCPAITIQFLGRPRVLCENVCGDVALPAQTLLVFAMLVMSNCEMLDREEIAFTLWPDLSESEARGTLRRQIYCLAQALPQPLRSFLVCDSRRASWNCDGAAYVDVREFMRLSESVESLDAAARVYRGEFLPRVDHEWATTVREQLRRRACRVLERLVERKRCDGNKRAALEYVERLLELDPWREDAIRDLVMLRFETGDRAGAIAYYRAFRHRLKNEFDVDPMPETENCFRTIAHGAGDHRRWTSTID